MPTLLLLLLIGWPATPGPDVTPAPPPVPLDTAYCIKTVPCHARPGEYDTRDIHFRIDGEGDIGCVAWKRCLPFVGEMPKGWRPYDYRNQND